MNSQFSVGETVAVVDANNQLRFAKILEDIEMQEDDRVHVQWSEGGTARPHKCRVAHLFTVK